MKQSINWWIVNSDGSLWLVLKESPRTMISAKAIFFTVLPKQQNNYTNHIHIGWPECEYINSIFFYFGWIKNAKEQTCCHAWDWYDYIIMANIIILVWVCNSHTISSCLNSNMSDVFVQKVSTGSMQSF